MKLGCTNGGIETAAAARRSRRRSRRSITNGGIDTSGLAIETSGENVPAPPRWTAERRRRPHRARRHQRRHHASPAADDQLAQPTRFGLASRRCSSPSTAASPSVRSLDRARGAAGALRHGLQHRSIQVGVEHRRVDVALAAHRLACCPAAWPPTPSPGRCSSWPARPSRTRSKSRSSCAASTVPAQVRKSFDVNSSPVISCRYAFTSADPIVWRSPSSSQVLEQLVARQCRGTP